MSLILDALKKLDREKTSGRGGDPDIAAGILSHDPGPKAPYKKMSLIISGLLFAAVIAGVGIYAALSGTGGQPQPRQAAALPAATAPNPAPAAPLKTDQIAQNSPSAEKNVTRAETAAVPEKKQAAATQQARPAMTEKRDKALRADEPDAAGTPVKISVIIWDEEPANRRAVVNGTLVGEGEKIEDMKVEQIYPTRIKFSRKGRTFDEAIN